MGQLPRMTTGWVAELGRGGRNLPLSLLFSFPGFERVEGDGEEEEVWGSGWRLVNPRALCTSFFLAQFQEEELQKWRTEEAASCSLPLMPEGPWAALHA